MSKCHACAEAFRARAYRDRFCSNACRIRANNVRAKRGALLYDLLMVAEISKDAKARGEAKARLERLVVKYVSDDAEIGVAFHKPYHETMQDTAYLTAEKLSD